MEERSDHTRGLTLGFVSYTLWGFFPIYWKLLDHRSPLEILAQRMFWAFIFYLVIYLAFSFHDRANLFKQSARNWKLLIAGAALLTLNWGIYVYAVNSGHILESSLAYFINPIMNVAVGVIFFKENFPLPLKVAVGLATIGVAARLALSPELPWISLVIATTFCTYGITKKLLKNPVIQTSVIEGLISAPFALAGILYFQSTNTVPAGTYEWSLFAFGGVVTGLPIALFSYAAQKVPYSVLGLLQFIAPSLQFLTAIVIFHEALGTHDFISFGLIWAGILFYIGYNARFVRKPIPH